MALFSRKKPKKDNTIIVKSIFPKSRLRKFYAAAEDNLTFGWGQGVLSADTEIKGGLVRLRGRSRDLAINDPYFRKYLKMLKENVVGSQGFKLNIKIIEKITDGVAVFDTNANDIIEAAWNEWSQKGNCTVDGRLSLNQVLRIAVQSLARDGEIFIRKVTGHRGNDFRFALQMIEADHVDVNYFGELSNGNYINMGIEYNAIDKPVAYHFLSRHPGDDYVKNKKNYEYIRVPAEEVIHFYDPERASQSRGFPWFCASALRSKHLNGYEEAELVASRGAASKMGFIETTDGEYQADAISSDSEGNEQQINEMEPGIIEKLGAGQKFVSYDPTHPTTAFKDFVKSILRGISTGLGVGYNTLANDYEGVNFSSLRQSNLSEREFYKEIQDLVIETILDSIYPDWLLLGLTTQKIKLPIAKFEKFNVPSWKPRGWGWVDPLKEVKAHGEAIDRNLKSATSVTAEMGYDIEEVFKDKANEKRLMKKYGIEESGVKKPITDGDVSDEEE